MSKAKSQTKTTNDPIAIWISFTGFLATSIFLSIGTDPFNLPKMFVLGIGSMVILFLLLNKFLTRSSDSNKAITALSILFLISLLVALFFSEAPMWQQIYGVYGRNTGFLTETSLLILFVASSNLRNNRSHDLIVKMFFSAGLFNLFIGTLELLNLNPQRVGLSYADSLIGTLGNPNFFGAFLGIFGGLIWIKFLSVGNSKSIRIVYLAIFATTGYLILESNAKQGLLILLFGFAISSLAYLKYMKLHKAFLPIAISISVSLGSLAVLGMLQIGPLTRFLYKTSVSLRGEYWAAGLNMFQSNVLTGTGLNSYGDWYRFSRRSSALILPGSEVTTNSAHNVFIDYLSGGGIFLFGAYFLIHTYVGYSAYKVLSRKKHFDPLFTSIFIGWLGYLAQSVISIDQIGLSVWGWIFAGLLISYFKNEMNHEADKNPSSKAIKKNPMEKFSSRETKENLRSPLFTLAGLLVGLLVTFPAQSVDVNWRKALNGAGADALIASAKAWPRNEYITARTVASLYESKLYSQALDLAIEGTGEFPRSTSLWKMLYFLPNTPAGLRDRAKFEINKLDPLNPLE
jgi:hypothetical protein